MSLIMLYFLNSTYVFSFYIDVVLTLSIESCVLAEIGMVIVIKRHTKAKIMKLLLK